ncbi:hypothetical protein HPG69_004149, partial [Diceros bicornis minor]
SPSESQNRLRPGSTQRPGKTDNKEFSVTWHLFVVTLGILCLLLLEEILRNLRQKNDIIQNENYLKEQLLTNKTLEYDILKNETLQQKKELDSLFIGKKRCHRKQIFSKSLQNTVRVSGFTGFKYRITTPEAMFGLVEPYVSRNSVAFFAFLRLPEGKLYEDRWSCCGGKCYYFTTEKKDWKGCKQTCRNYNLSLLKIDDKDELAFIQPQTYPDNYWIGLSYNAKESKWKWIDSGTSSGTNFIIRSLPSGSRRCVFLTSTRVTDIDCSNTYNCICEKRLDCVSTACFN